jgi:predicted lipoprotein with Yx(FWY)xxD motif
MRKSGWAVAAGLASLALLLTACGGSSPSSSATSSTTPTAGGQPTSALGIGPGTTVLIVQSSDLGWVMAKADGHVVYTYAGDKKGGTPTCTGACASVWQPVTGTPMVGPADSLPFSLGTVSMASGGKQITYNGYPLYTLKGAGALTTKGNGGMWHVIKLSKSDITSGV